MKLKTIIFATLLLTTISTATAVDVSIDPSGEKTVSTGTSVTVEGQTSTSSGDIDQIMIQINESGEWNTDTRKFCSSSSCSISDSYRSFDETSKDLRIKAVKDSESYYSNNLEITWKDETDSNANIESVSMTPDTGQELNEGESITINGELKGDELDWIAVQVNKNGDWDTDSRKFCSTSPCTIEKDYRSFNDVEKDYRIKAKAGTNKKETDKITVDWIQEDTVDETEETKIDSIDIDPSTNQNLDTGESIKIKGTLKGNKLDWVSLQIKEDGSWEHSTRNFCSSSPCTVNEEFRSFNDIEKEFRIKGDAGSDQETTGKIVVDWTPEETVEDGPEAFFTVSNSNPLKNEPVKFDASGSEGNILEYRWSFEDQTTRFGETIFKSFSKTGEQKVTLRVTEYDGDQDKFSRTLNVRSKKECRVHVGGLQFEDSNIDAGETTEAKVRVSNTGGNQKVNVKIFRDSEKVLDRDDTINRGDEKSFKVDITAEKDANIEAEVRTSGEPCGSQLFQRTKTLEVDEEDEVEEPEGNVPEAELDIDPSNADTSEEIEFDATGSSDPDGEIEEYEFDLNGDGEYEITTDEGEVERSFVQAVNTRATVRVIDDDGYTDTDSESYRVEAKNRVSFSNIQAPSKVCSGESFDVSMDVKNIGDDERLVILEGEGFGDAQSHSTLLDEDEQERVTITFSPSSTGTKDYTIEPAGGNSDRVSRSINVLECEETIGKATGISMKVIPNRVRAGEPVKVSGYVDDTRGPQEVKIEMGSQVISDIETEPDGYYQTYINPDRVGKFSLTATSNERTTSRTLEVLPTVDVVSVSAPEKVFQSDKFDVCGRVESEVTPLVVFMKNGERMESRYDSGEVCFETEPSEEGETNYQIMALAQGARSTSGTKVEVMKSKPEASSFPEKIASVESGDGIVKATIYNNNDDQKKYNVGISGLPDTWTSTSEKEVILQPGEEREVFFYLTPQKEGRHDAFITITSDRSIVYTDSIEVITGGTSKPKETSIIGRLRNAFLW